MRPQLEASSVSLRSTASAYRALVPVVAWQKKMRGARSLPQLHASSSASGLLMASSASSARFGGTGALSGGGSPLPPLASTSGRPSGRPSGAGSRAGGRSGGGFAPTGRRAATGGESTGGLDGFAPADAEAGAGLGATAPVDADADALAEAAAVGRMVAAEMAGGDDGAPAAEGEPGGDGEE